MSKPTAKRASVRVPASTSNLGAGFDCVGMAVDRWLRVSAEVRFDGRGEVSILRTGTLRALDVSGPSDLRSDLLYVGFKEVSRTRDGRDGFDGSISFEADSDIPVARGLGSSAAALLAGAALANETLGLGLDTATLAQICARVEGHGDNVGASALGGAILVTPKWQALLFTPLAVHESLGFAFAVPDFETHTDLARATLPTQVPFRTAVTAAAKSAALVQGLSTGNRQLLTSGLADVLHVEHRKPLVPHYERVVRAACGAGAFGATLSGSGSSLVAIAPRDTAPIVAGAMAEAWRGVNIPADAFAARVCLAGLSVVSPTHRLPDSPTHLPRNIACP
jgi:homoserine kinase